MTKSGMLRLILVVSLMMAAIFVAPSRALRTVAATGPVSLGVFSLLNNSYDGANALTVLYGASSEGNPLITYWKGADDLNVLSIGNGQYEIAETLGGRCMTDSGPGSAITITTCAVSSKQIVVLALQSNGSYVIQFASGLCLASHSAGTVAESETCDGSPGQDWTFTGSAPLSLSNATTTTTTTSTPTTTTSTATTTSTPSTTPPANPSTTPSTTGTNSSTGTGTTTSATSLGVFSLLVEGYLGPNALTLLYGASSEGDPLITYWKGSDVLSVLTFGNGQYEIAETLGGRCITDNGSGATVTITACAGSSSQLFLLKPQTDGSYVIQSSTGICLASAGGGTVAQMRTCDASPNQNWTFSGANALNLGAPAATNSSTTSAVPAGYHLTFDDEFQSLSMSDTNGTGSKWYTHTIQCCMGDSAVPPAPTYMAGLSDGPGKNPYSIVPGQGLDIRLQKTNGAWYSGVLATVDGTGHGFSQQYGYFEMKANFPSGLGTWPAFWLLNSNHLTQGSPSGEIDVVEAYMQFPAIVDTTLHDYSNGTSVGTHQAPVTDMTAGFHTYGMLWTASTMTFYFDGRSIWQIPTPAIMNQPYYPIIDLGLGGGWPTDKTPQQSDMIVQYVRVYAP